MKLLGISLLLGICFSLGTLRAVEVAKENGKDNSQFVINVNKPYAYLAVDHVGPREPVRADEPSVGVWLRLRNNCRLSIVVLAIGERDGSGKEGIALEDEIVPDPQAIGVGEDVRMSGIGGPVGLKGAQGLMDIFRWQDRTEEEVRNAEKWSKASSKPIERPRGYGVENGFEYFMLTLIAPGEGLYISVPANHVSENWHLEIPFRLALANKSGIRPPYSYVALYWDDLSEAERAAIKEGLGKSPGKGGDSGAHDGGPGKSLPH